MHLGLAPLRLFVKGVNRTKDRANPRPQRLKPILSVLQPPNQRCEPQAPGAEPDNGPPEAGLPIGLRIELQLMYGLHRLSV